MNPTDFVLPRFSGIRWLLLKRTRNPHVAEDLCQNVLLKCWIYFQQKRVVPPYPFVKRVALNEFYSWVRKRVPQFMPESRLTDLPWRGDPSRAIEEEERVRAMRSEVEALRPEDRDLTKMRYLEGRPLSDIAEDKNLEVGAVKSRLYRVRSLLKEKLKRFRPE